MHILLVSTNYLPEKTGIGKYNGEMAEWFASRGHDVTVIAGPPHYPEWKVHDGYDPNRASVERRHGVEVRRVPMRVPPLEELSSRNRILMEASYTRHARRAWKGLSPDVVIAVCPPMQAAVHPWRIAGRRGVPWVFHVQDLQVDAAFRLGMLKPGLAERVLGGVERFFLRKATRVSTITGAMRDRIVAKGIPPERVWLVPNWADVQAIRPSSHDNAFRRQVGAGPEDVLFLYAGNMGRKQGLDLIVRAADLLRDEPRFRFVIVGSGADEPAVKALAAELAPPNLAFLPLQPLERLPEMLAAADVHLVVQKHEAADLVMPSKLTNILAAGRPSVATALPGTTLHQVLTEHDAGLCLPYGDLEAFCDVLRSIGKDGVGRDRMGGNARRYAERWLDKEAILRDFEGKLASLVQESKAG